MQLHPRLKRTIEQVETPEGHLILMRPSANDIRIEQPDDGERKLLAALDGTRSREDLHEQFGVEVVETVIEQMQALDLLEDASDDVRVPLRERERFDRQLRYFSDLSHHDGPTPSECQARLRAARVAVLGVGGLGGRTAWELACCGVGELLLIDGDRVEESNLNRQIQYTEADIGRLKVEAMAARLRAFNTNIDVHTVPRRIESQAELKDVIAGADLVVDAADWPAYEIEHWCNAACFEVGVPFIAMSHYPPVARAGPLYVPGKTGCFECQTIAYRREYPLFDVAVEQRRAKPSPAATLGPACGLVGGLVGAEVMHFLTELLPPAMLGVGYLYDLRTMAVERYEVVPEPGCRVCAHLQEEITSPVS
ncbi:MAG TPA: TOMM precursor leader peptide-binding protein [Solirubrobacterales bacterium]|jgi:bacteriocin biosynthesis cyclodehydratase domain-containing protein|nr:TOMM precursor leader peptide-binding protein [Solirubrobacterales bacterium]